VCHRVQTMSFLRHCISISDCSILLLVTSKLTPTFKFLAIKYLCMITCNVTLLWNKPCRIQNSVHLMKKWRKGSVILNFWLLRVRRILSTLQAYLIHCNDLLQNYSMPHTGVGDGGQGARAPQKFGKKFFGQLLCKIRAFFRQESCKIQAVC